MIFNDTLHHGILLDFGIKHKITKSSLQKSTKKTGSLPHVNKTSDRTFRSNTSPHKISFHRKEVPIERHYLFTHLMGNKQDTALK